jgi:hypothetical protein
MAKLKPVMPVDLLSVGETVSRPVRLSRQDITLRWHVSSFERNDKLGGLVAQLEGNAGVGAKPSVVARATILVKAAAP